MLTRGQRFESATANGLVAAFILLWWLYSKQVPEYILPGPTDILGQVGALLFSPSLAVHTYTSLLRVVASVVAALILGTTLVIVADNVVLLRTFVGQRLIPFLNAFPSLGWAMLGVVWFGISDASVVFIQTAILLPFTMLNVWEGLRAIDEEIIEMGTSFTRNRIRLIREISLPLLAPYIMSAVRVSYGVAWKVALIAELFGSSVGIGYLMNLSRQNFDTPLTLACIVIVIIFVSVVDRFVLQVIYARLRMARTEAPGSR